MEVPTRIEIESGERVTLSWEDGTSMELTASRLRETCPCAACREPAGAAATAAVVTGPEPVRIAEAKLVGNYAINFVFEPDHHATGIYPFDELRHLGEGAD